MYMVPSMRPAVVMAMLPWGMGLRLRTCVRISSPPAAMIALEILLVRRAVGPVELTSTAAPVSTISPG